MKKEKIIYNLLYIKMVYEKRKSMLLFPFAEMFIKYSEKNPNPKREDMLLAYIFAVLSLIFIGVLFIVSIILIILFIIYMIYILFILKK